MEKIFKKFMKIYKYHYFKYLITVYIEDYRIYYLNLYILIEKRNRKYYYNIFYNI